MTIGFVISWFVRETPLSVSGAAPADRAEPGAIGSQTRA